MDGCVVEVGEGLEEVGRGLTSLAVLLGGEFVLVLGEDFRPQVELGGFGAVLVFCLQDFR